MWTYPRCIFIHNFEQRKRIFVIHRSLKRLQNAVEYLHNKSGGKRWQKNSNVSCSVTYYGEHFVLGVAGVYLNHCTADSTNHAFVQTTLFCLGRLREAVVLRVKVCVFCHFIGVLKLFGIFSVSCQEKVLGPGAIIVGRLCSHQVEPCLSVGPLFCLGVCVFWPN